LYLYVLYKNRRSEKYETDALMRAVNHASPTVVVYHQGEPSISLNDLVRWSLLFPSTVSTRQHCEAIIRKDQWCKNIKDGGLVLFATEKVLKRMHILYHILEHIQTKWCSFVWMLNWFECSQLKLTDWKYSFVQVQIIDY